MLKTILKISIPIILIGIILFIGFNAYKKTIVSTEDPITVIPSNASAILKINDVRNEKIKKSLLDGSFSSFLIIAI